jgi:hypothetical protein
VEDNVSRREVERLRRGEVGHHLFQAVGRGAIRKSVGGDCPAGCHLWIATSSLGAPPIQPELLKTIFPDSRLESWQPLPQQLKKSEVAFVAAVETCLKDKDEVTVTVEDIGDQAGCSWNRVLRRFEEQRAVEELRRRGIAVGGPDRKSPLSGC